MNKNGLKLTCRCKRTGRNKTKHNGYLLYVRLFNRYFKNAIPLIPTMKLRTQEIIMSTSLVWK